MLSVIFKKLFGWFSSKPEVVLSPINHEDTWPFPTAGRPEEEVAKPVKAKQKRKPVKPPVLTETNKKPVETPKARKNTAATKAKSAVKKARTKLAKNK